MHQAQWSPERPLPPPVSLASQSHHEKPPEVNLKNNRMISVRFQGKPFNITVIQVYAPTSNAGDAEWFYEDLQHLLELMNKKDILFIIGAGMQKYEVKRYL